MQIHLFDKPVTTFVFEISFVAGKFFLFTYFSAVWGFPNNGLEHKVGKISLYSVPNLLLKIETFLPCA